MVLEQQIFDFARWLLVMIALWWVVGATLWFSALRGEHVWLSRLATAVALPGGRRIAQATLAVSLTALPACSPERSQPALVYLGEATSASTLAPMQSTTTPPSSFPLPTSTQPTSTQATGTQATGTGPDANDPLPTPSSANQPTSDELAPEVAAAEHTVDSDAPSTTGRYTVVVGDHLWSIAAQHLSSSGETPDIDQIARYWRGVIAANAETIRSGNPDLIFPGETIELPPLS